MCSVNKLISTFDHMEEHAIEYYGLKKEQAKENLCLAPNVPIVKSLIEPNYLSICDDQWLIVNKLNQNEDNLNCLVALNLLLDPYIREPYFSIWNFDMYHNISDAIEKVFTKKS